MGAPSHGPAFGGIQTIQVLYGAAGNPIRVQVHGNGGVPLTVEK